MTQMRQVVTSATGHRGRRRYQGLCGRVPRLRRGTGATGLAASLTTVFTRLR